MGVMVDRAACACLIRMAAAAALIASGLCTGPAFAQGTLIHAKQTEPPRAVPNLPCATAEQLEKLQKLLQRWHAAHIFYKIADRRVEAAQSKVDDDDATIKKLEKDAPSPTREKALVQAREQREKDANELSSDQQYFLDRERDTLMRANDYNALLDAIPKQCPPKPGLIVPPHNRFSPRSLPIDFVQYGASIVGGGTHFGGPGSLAFRDAISDETAATDQPLSGGAATLGVLGSVSLPSPFGPQSTFRPYVEAGFLGFMGNHRSGLFSEFSPNLATGMTTLSQNWSAPMMLGLTAPLASLPNFSVQLQAGGFIDHRTLALSMSEVLPSLQTSASITRTQFNPGMGIGVRYQLPGSPFSIGGRAMLDFQRAFSLTAQSEPFPSAFYTVSIGSQVASTFLIEIHFDSDQQTVSMALH
jgi:hypothetical protein